MTGAYRRSVIAEQGETESQAVEVKGELGKPVRMPVHLAGATPARTVKIQEGTMSTPQTGKIFAAICAVMKDDWRPAPVAGYESLYEINSDGYVRRVSACQGVSYAQVFAIIHRQKRFAGASK